MPQALRNSRRWLARLLACGALVGLGSLAGCGKKKAPADTTSIDQPHPPDTVPGATAIATLERTGCYGECPVYRLTVNSDGSVVYVGTRWVKVLGRQVYRLSEAQMAELQAAFERANFNQLHDYDKVESNRRRLGAPLLSPRRRLQTSAPLSRRQRRSAALGVLEDEFDRIVDSGRLGSACRSASGTSTPSPTGVQAPTEAAGFPAPR